MPESSIPHKLRLRTSILVAISMIMVLAMSGWGTMRSSRPSTLPTGIVYDQVNDTFTVETRRTPWWSIALAPEDLPFYTMLMADSDTESRVEGLYINPRFVTGTMGTELRSEAGILPSSYLLMRQAPNWIDSCYNRSSDRDDPDARLLVAAPPSWNAPNFLDCTNGTWTLNRKPLVLSHQPNAFTETLTMTVNRLEPSKYQRQEFYQLIIDPKVKPLSPLGSGLVCGLTITPYEQNWFKRKLNTFMNHLRQ